MGVRVPPFAPAGPSAGPPTPRPVRLSPALLALAASVLVAGCAATDRAATSAAPPADPYGRSSDGLLHRPDLQALVDLQIRRDAGGLVEALASPDSLVRARAAFALGSVQAEEAVPALRRLLSDPVPAVRADAAFALGQTADSTAGVALVVALRTEATPAVLTEVLDALGKTGGRADLAALLAASLPDHLEPARALALARMGMRGITSPAWSDWLTSRLQASDPDLRRTAAYALTRAPVDAWRSDAGRVRAAFDALPGDPARGSLTRALDRLDDPQDTDRLVAALTSDPDWRTRVGAARALQGRAGDDATGALAAATTDLDDHVAQTAMTSLADGETPTDLQVALALDHIGTDRPWPVQAAALPLLARTGHADLVLAWADRQPDPFAQAAALRALGASDDGAALTRLFTAARADDVRLAAAALDALVARWETGTYGSRRFFDAFAHGLRRGDLATTTISAPVLADSAFWAFSPGPILREAYAGLDAPEDVEPMAAIIGAVGRVRDGSEVDFLVGIALGDGPPVLREAARDALNDRLSEGVDVEISGGSTSGTTSIDWTHLARVGRHPRLVLETDRGRVTIEMDTEAAPQTVQLLTTTAANDLYDGVPFHRVVPDFVVQGGDYFRRDGYGGPETPIRSEFTRIRYATGTAGMASSGKDTEGVQFFLTHSPQPHLDGRYTAFGRVVEGQDVVDRLLQGDLIRRARVVPDRQRPARR